MGQAAYQCEVDTSKRPSSNKGFVPQKGRWQVERSFGWLNFFRRLAREEIYLRENRALSKGFCSNYVRKYHFEQMGLDVYSNMVLIDKKGYKKI